MANALSAKQLGPTSWTALDVNELARRLDLIEDRPESGLTWTDVGRHVRALWRRLGVSTRKR